MYNHDAARGINGFTLQPLLSISVKKRMDEHREKEPRYLLALSPFWAPFPFVTPHSIARTLLVTYIPNTLYYIPSADPGFSNSATQQRGGVGPYAGVGSNRPGARLRSQKRPGGVDAAADEAGLWLAPSPKKGASTSSCVSAGGPGTCRGGLGLVWYGMVLRSVCGRGVTLRPARFVS
jgi:hypothetical protein